MKPPHTRPQDRGAVLVTTLIVLTVLAVVAVAFMQSSSMDQLASRSVSGAFQAQLIADAAVGMARGEVTRLIARYPDSVTVWQNIGGSNTNEATVLYARSNVTEPNNPARPGQFGGEVSYIGFPLVSRVDPAPVAVDALSSVLPYAASDPLMVNLNATNASRTNAFVGERSMTNPGAPIAAAQWIYIGRLPGPTNATNPPIGRYAYWVEDESFKVNVNTATNGARGTSTNSGPDDIRLDGSWQSSLNAGVRAANAATVVSDRGTNQSFFPTAGSAAVAAALTNAASAAEFRFLTTAHSAGLDLSRGGFKRFNLNTITNGDKRTALNRIITTITNTNAAPLFGQRFYRLANNVPGINSTNAVSSDHAALYLQKIAANIYDYIDADSQPTVISNNPPAFTLMTNKPAYGIEALGGGVDGANPMAAMGVEAVPRLQEYAIHARLRSMRYDTNDPNSFGWNSTNPPASGVPTEASYEIWIDHYFEFWNPSTTNIVLTNAFLKIFDQPRWGTNITGDLSVVDRETTELPVNNVTFPAGRVTVLTTAPVGTINIGNTAGGFALISGANASNVVSIPTPDADRIFRGVTRDIRTDRVNTDYGYNRLFDVTLRARSTNTQDYRSGFVLGNDNGILDSHVGLPIGGLTGSGALSMCVSNFFIYDGLSHRTNQGLPQGNNDNVRGGSLLGNQNAVTRPSAFEGDPRALLEQLVFSNNAPSSAGAGYTNLTRFFNAIGDGQVPGQSSLGAPNANFVFPTNWTDVSSQNAGSNNAPLVVRNGPMQSIGELGHITDPARPTYATTGPVPELARGGGRTLRVGQPEVAGTGGGNIAWYTGNQTNASRTWTSWRLADIFTVATNTNVVIRGLINPNGALRDNGAALRAALFGFRFLSPPDGGITNLPLINNSSAYANLSSNVVASVVARLTNGNAAGLGTGTLNPFWERGEISEMSILNSPASGTVLGSFIMSNAFDRGREELVRRSMEMITTRGSVFTVYAIGQSLRVTTNSTNITGTVRVRSTFEMTPQLSLAATNDAFNPGSAPGVNQRFAPVTNYTSKILNRSYD